MANQKPRVSRHNGRAGKHGVYNPKHNDRQFDVAHAENIHQDRTRLNLYWDWQNGLRNHEENQSGQYPTFNQVERDFYEQRYGDYLAGQAARNVKAGHAGRNRTVDDLLSDARICPEETIYQIGKEGDCPPPEVLLEIIQEFMATIQERFGSHVHVLDWSLHLDETSPHIHARQVFDIENRYGEIEPKQEKALEALGIPLPFPEKKPGRQNNRKITFDSICRELLLNICEEHGLEVERDAIYGGRENREKNDYIIQAQRERIAELERRITPDTLGVASGASFGAALGILLGFKMIGIQLTSLTMGASAVALTWLCGRGRGRGLSTVVLSGIMIGSLFSALVSLVKFAADAESQLPAITYWLMGGLDKANYSCPCPTTRRVPPACTSARCGL